MVRSTKNKITSTLISILTLFYVISKTVFSLYVEEYTKRRQHVVLACPLTSVVTWTVITGSITSAVGRVVGTPETFSRRRKSPLVNGLEWFSLGDTMSFSFECLR